MYVSVLVIALNRIWRSNTISFASKFKLYKSLVTSILLYGCETKTLLAASEERIQAFESKSLRKLLCTSYLEHKTNDWVRSKIMTNSTNIITDMSMNVQKLEEVTSFKYLGATLCKFCKPVVRIMIASAMAAMAAMARLNRIWWCNTISFTDKFKLYRSLVTSILLYGCETMTLLADSEKRIQVFKTKCMRKHFCIPYLKHKTSN